MCTQDTQCRAGVSCHRMIMKYTHDEYCDTLQPSVSVIRELVLLQGNTRCLILVDVIQMLMCLEDWIRISTREEV
jgi:hypothetical protein